MIGRDLHLVGVVGKQQLLDSAEELALNTAWLGQRIQTHRSDPADATADPGGSLAATPVGSLDPTIFSVRSQVGDRLSSGVPALQTPRKNSF